MANLDSNDANMTRQKLTKSVIDSLKTPVSAPGTDGRLTVWDTEIPGFGIRISSSGARKFILYRRIKGKQEKVTIGEYGPWTPEQARKRAKELSVQYDKGISVNTEKRAERMRGATLKDVFDDYKATHRLRENTLTTYGFDIARLGAEWASRPLRDITKDMVRAKYIKLCDELGSGAANKSMRVFRAVFNHAKEQSEGEFPDNPVKLKGYWRDVGKRRQTIIKDSELPKWNKAIKELNNPLVEDLFELYLRTGLRKMEPLTLEWCAVDMIEGTFTLKEGAAKNHREWTRYMSRQVRAIFQRCLDRKENAYVFPGINAESHLTFPHRQAEIIIEKSGVTFCPHDIRRTFTTIANDTVSPMQIKYLLNHKTGDITQGYIILSKERKIEAEQRMGDAIDRLIAAPVEGNVVSITSSKKARQGGKA